MSHGGGEIEVPHDHNDPVTKRVALSVAIFAVILAVAGLGGKNAGKDMLSEQITGSDEQISASNEWSRYQAKTVREAISINDLDKNEIELTKPDLPPATKAQLEKSAERMKKKVEEYKKDKEEIMAEARKHEDARKAALQKSHIAHTKDSYFDYAELLIQIAIVIASVSMLSKSHYLWIAGIVLVLIATVLTINGYTLTFHIGFIEGH